MAQLTKVMQRIKGATELMGVRIMLEMRSIQLGTLHA